MKVLIFKNSKILLEIYLIPLTFIIFKNLIFCLKSTLSHWHLSFIVEDSFGEIPFLLTFIIFWKSEDSIGQRRYANEIYLFIRIWKMCWKDIWSHWHLFILKTWKFCRKDTLSHWHLLFLRIWRVCWKDTLSNCHLLLSRNLKILLDRYLIPLTFIICKEFENSAGKIPYPTEIY